MLLILFRYGANGELSGYKVLLHILQLNQIPDLEDI